MAIHGARIYRRTWWLNLDTNDLVIAMRRSAATTRRPWGDGGKKPALVGTSDPFGEYSAAQFIEEAEILEMVSPLWNVQFVQATLGAGANAGGLYEAYSKDGNIRAVVHPEVISLLDNDTVNFWAPHCDNGLEHAKKLGVPFVLVVLDSQDRTLHTMSSKDGYGIKSIGVPVRGSGKDGAYGDTMNVCHYIESKFFQEGQELACPGSTV